VPIVRNGKVMTEGKVELMYLRKVPYITTAVSYCTQGQRFG